MKRLLSFLAGAALLSSGFAAGLLSNNSFEETLPAKKSRWQIELLKDWKCNLNSGTEKCDIAIVQPGFSGKNAVKLHTIGPRYMKYRNVRTEFVDFPTNSVVAELGIKHQPSFAWGPISELTNWPGGPLLIGEMVARDGGSAKAIFVSSQNDYRDAGAPTRWVNFKAKGKVRVTKGSGDWPIHEGDNGFYAFPLDASEGVLIEVE